MRFAALILGGLLIAGAAWIGGSMSRPATPPMTPTPSYQAKTLSLTSATVTDPSVPFASNESEALVPRGLYGEASYGRIGAGCQVAVVKVTDRAAQVKVVRCPDGDSYTDPPGLKEYPVMGTLVGWVARSALDLKP